MAVDYPTMITPVNHIEPVPRRIRAKLGATPSWTPPARCTSGSGRTIPSTTSPPRMMCRRAVPRLSREYSRG